MTWASTWLTRPSAPANRPSRWSARRSEAAVLPSCERQDLGVLAREALAGGLLSGKLAPGTNAAAADLDLLAVRR
jgi:aryl-alcohol dehydrogenase-like predicted oxidoreductase